MYACAVMQRKCQVHRGRIWEESEFECSQSQGEAQRERAQYTSEYGEL